MLNLSSRKVLTPQCVLWLAAQMKVFKSLSLVMEFFFTTNLVFTMCYLIPPNHIFTSLHFILFHPILFQPIPFYLLLFHLNPSFPIHFYSSSSHLFSLIQSHFFAYTSLFPYHINPLSSFLHPFHPILSHLIICHAVAMYTIPSYFVPSPFSPPILSHPILYSPLCSISSHLFSSSLPCSLPSHFSHTHPFYLTQSCYFCSHPVSSHPIILHFLLPIHFFPSYLLFSRPIFFPKSVPDPVSLHSHSY